MRDAPATLTCPKCAGPMRSYERNRVVVDQCTVCAGLFLDRGELETLQAAESAYYGAPGTPPDGGSRADRRDDRRGYDDLRPDDRYRHGYEDNRYRKKKKSFLSELFDD